MFGITWSEMALIAIVALIFIGPKELPNVLRTVGKWITAARNMAREFQGHVDDLVRETELDEVRRNIRENTSAALNDLANHIDPDRTLREGVDPDKLIAGEGDNAPAAAAAVAGGESATNAAIAPPPPDVAPPSAQELKAFAGSIGEQLEPGGEYHPPADMPAPDTAPLAPLPPLPKEKAASEPAKNPGVAEPGRA